MKTSPIICSSATLNPKTAPPPNKAPIVTPTPWPSPRASASTGRSTHAARPVHRTARSSAILPPPTSTRTGASAGASSPTAASGVSTTAAPSPRASGYYEVDLAAAVQADDDSHALRAFRLLFGRPAFSPQHGAQTSFLEDAIAEGRRYEEQVANDLSGTVFDEVYPALIRALSQKSGAELEHVRQAALIFLYRLLFLLYAEDRDLLPVNDSRYDDYGLRKSVRDDIDKRIAAGDTFSTIASNYYNHIATLCRQIDEGDASIGLPPYNGGLFAQQAAPMLEQVSLSDAVLAPIIHNLSRR